MGILTLIRWLAGPPAYTAVAVTELVVIDTIVVRACFSTVQVPTVREDSDRKYNSFTSRSPVLYFKEVEVFNPSINYKKYPVVFKVLNVGWGQAIHPKGSSLIAGGLWKHHTRGLSKLWICLGKGGRLAVLNFFHKKPSINFQGGRFAGVEQPEFYYYLMDGFIQGLGLEFSGYFNPRSLIGLHALAHLIPLQPVNNCGDDSNSEGEPRNNGLWLVIKVTLQLLFLFGLGLGFSWFVFWCHGQGDYGSIKPWLGFLFFFFFLCLPLNSFTASLSALEEAHNCRR